MAVVLLHRVRAAPVHAAGHPAIRVLVLREPFEVGAHGLGMAQAQEGRGDQRAVADPGARVGARARTDRRTVALEESVSEVAPERPQERLRGGRTLETDSADLLAPLPRAGSEAPGDETPGLPPRQQPVTRRFERVGVERKLERDLVGRAGRKIEVERESARGVAEAVADALLHREP